MATIREIFVRLGIKTDPKGMRQAETGINRLKTSAVSLGRVLATGAVALGFRQLITTASDIAETANKFGAVFGEAGDGVQAQLDAIRQRTGATNLQLQEMSSSIGALIKPALGSAEAAGQMAAGVSELALDIASFNNVTADEALIALRAGLIGSQEPLQRFGVDVRVAALQQEALRQGIATNVKDMTQGQRVTLRYAAIMRQLGTQGALGDATRTAEGFANASRNLIAALRETAGMIGTFLLGSVGRLVLSIRSVVDNFQAWMGANRELIQQRVDRFLDRTGRVIEAVASLVGDVVEVTTDWLNSLDPLGRQILKITGVVLALAAILLLPGGAILLIAAAIGLLIEDFQTWRDGGESVIGDIIGWFSELGDAVRGYLGILGESFDAFMSWAREHETGITLVTSLVAGLATVIGVKLVAANAAAIGSWLTLQAVGVAVWLSMTGQAIAAGIASVAAAAKSAAAWLVATLPLALTAALLGVIIGTLIFLGAELVKLARGEENFFSTMAEGIADLIERFGGILPAIGEMLQEALRFWVEFFGGSAEQVDEFVDNALITLKGLWDNVLDYWTEKLTAWWSRWSDVIDFGFGSNDDEEANERAQERARAAIARWRAQQAAQGGSPPAPNAAAREGSPIDRVVSPTVSVTGPVPRTGSTVTDNSVSNVSVNVSSQPGMNEQTLAEKIATETGRVLERENRQALQSLAVEAG